MVVLARFDGADLSARNNDTKDVDDFSRLALWLIIDWLAWTLLQ